MQMQGGAGADQSGMISLFPQPFASMRFVLLLILPDPHHATANEERKLRTFEF